MNSVGKALETATDVERASHLGDGQRNETEHDYDVDDDYTTRGGGRQASWDGIVGRSLLYSQLIWLDAKKALFLHG